jgi:UDP-glucose 6-dehydrogenase
MTKAVLESLYTFRGKLFSVKRIKFKPNKNSKHLHIAEFLKEKGDMVMGYANK